MGETEQENPEYLSVATELPFSMLQSKDIDNLATIFSDPQYGYLYASIFSALLSKPEELKEMLHSLLPVFRKIGFIQNDKALSKSDKDVEINPIRYTYTNMFAERMEQHFIPAMENAFSIYDDILTEEHNKTESLLPENPTDTVVVKDAIVTAIPENRAEDNQ